MLSGFLVRGRTIVFGGPGPFRNATLTLWPTASGSLLVASENVLRIMRSSLHASTRELRLLSSIWEVADFQGFKVSDFQTFRLSGFVQAWTFDYVFGMIIEMVKALCF